MTHVHRVPEATGYASVAVTEESTRLVPSDTPEAFAFALTEFARS